MVTVNEKVELDTNVIRKACKPVILYSSAAESIKRQHEHFLVMLKQFHQDELQRLEILKRTKSHSLKSRLLHKFELEREKEAICIERMKEDMKTLEQLASTGEYRGRVKWHS